MSLIPMRTVRALAAFSIALALGAAAVPSEAGASRQAVHGKFAAQIEGDDAAGRFNISHRVNDRGVVLDRIEAGAVKLDTTKDTNGDRPSYHVFLVSADASQTADFGQMRLTKRGRAAFFFNTRADALPEGVTDVTDFDGGTIEIRTGDTVVLSAAIPSFIGTGDDNTGTGGAFRRDTEALKPADRSIRTHGSIFARYANASGGVNEQLDISAERMSADKDDYTVVAIDSSANETLLCTFTANGRKGSDRVSYDTRNGDTIPGGGSVQDLSEQTVEMRDMDGDVVCTGKFPKVK